MPQGRRKIPFSGKRKKQQISNKRQDKSFPINLIRKINEESDTQSEISESSTLADRVQKIHVQPIKDTRGRSNRYVLQFHTESAKEIRELREKARQPLQYANEQDFEINDNYFENLDFPRRPKWSYSMSKEVLLANEERYFFKYTTALEKAHFDDMKNLCYFELNIENWRQLWRVLELSDIVLVIVDCRFPTLMFPPYLFNYITNELKKTIAILLNKIDLVESTVVLAWKKYFEEKYNSVNVILFTSYPAYNLRGNFQNKTGLNIRRRKGKMRMASEGAMEVYKACSSIVKGQVNLSSWHDKIQQEMTSDDTAGNEDDEEEVKYDRTHEEEKDFDFEEHELYKNGILTIGTIGFPNVGKSSVLNALIGKKVISVSRTPGHTKHFQTIFLTNSVRLVDCPGLVFPSYVPKNLQVLLGSFPISQLREPYASIKFLAERINLPKLLVLNHPDGDKEWTAMDICDAFAIKRGFYTAKASRPDSYRAANSILRMALDGKISLFLKPKGFFLKKIFWESHPELENVKEIQTLGKNALVNPIEDIEIYSDSENDQAHPSDYFPKEKIKTSELNTKNEHDGDDEDTDDDCDIISGTSNPFDLLNDNDE